MKTLNTKGAAYSKKELKEKHRLEAVFIPKLVPFFREIRNDFVRVYSTTGRIISLDQYRSKLEALVRDQYKRTQKAFKNSVPDRNGVKSFSYFLEKKQYQDDEQLTEDLIALGLLAWIDMRLKPQADIMLDTTNREINNSINRARNELAENNEPIDNLTVALTAAVFLDRSFSSRIPVIATFETQSAAESTKLITAEAMAGQKPYTLNDVPIATLPTKKKAEKTWFNVGDGRVRPTHVSANGQTVDLDEPFIVGGYRMRYPGDLSLGASGAEVWNCRCSAEIYFL